MDVIFLQRFLENFMRISESKINKYDLYQYSSLNDLFEQNPELSFEKQPWFKQIVNVVAKETNLDAKPIVLSFLQDMVSVYSRSKFYQSYLKMDWEEFAESCKYISKLCFGSYPLAIKKVLPEYAMILTANQSKNFVELVSTIIPPKKLQQFNQGFFQMIIGEIARVNAKYDYIVLLDGYEGTGKSTMAKNLAYFYHYIMFGKKLSKDNVIFTAQDFAKALKKYQHIHKEVFILDEAGAMLFSRNASSSLVKLQIELLEVMRARNWVVYIILPNINWIDVYIRKHRLFAWLMMYDRGNGAFFSKSQLDRSKEFSANKIDRQLIVRKWMGIRVSAPDFDYDKTILADYDDKKNEHIDRIIDQFYDKAMQNVSKDESEGTEDIQLNMFFNHTFPKIALLRDAKAVDMKRGKVLKDYALIQKQLLKNRVVFGRTMEDDLLHSLFVQGPKKRVLLSKLGITTSQWKNYLDSTQVATYSSTTIDFGFNLYRKYLLGEAVLNQFIEHHKSVKNPVIFWYSVFKFLKVELGLKNIFETFLYISAKLNEDVMVDIMRPRERIFLDDATILEQYILPNVLKDDFERALFWILVWSSEIRKHSDVEFEQIFTQFFIPNSEIDIDVSDEFKLEEVSKALSNWYNSIRAKYESHIKATEKKKSYLSLIEDLSQKGIFETFLKMYRKEGENLEEIYEKFKQYSSKIEDDYAKFLEIVSQPIVEEISNIAEKKEENIENVHVEKTKEEKLVEQLSRVDDMVFAKGLDEAMKLSDRHKRDNFEEDYV